MTLRGRPLSFYLLNMEGDENTPQRCLEENRTGSSSKELITTGKFMSAGKCSPNIRSNTFCLMFTVRSLSWCSVFFSYLSVSISSCGWTQASLSWICFELVTTLTSTCSRWRTSSCGNAAKQKNTAIGSCGPRQRSSPAEWQTS